MPGDLYWDDILVWSEQQAALLRRAAAGERVNDIDWPNIIEEIESVGRSERRACESLLLQAMRQLLKLQGWPLSLAREHWSGEAAIFLAQARRAVTPSMRQRIDLDDLWREASGLVANETVDGAPPRALPETCALTLGDLLADPPDVPGLLRRLAAGGEADLTLPPAPL